jgi:REP element-mobilizing transposase RayT
MRQRGYSVKTHQAYLGAVTDLARYYRRSPDRLGVEEVKAYLRRKHKGQVQHSNIYRIGWVVVGLLVIKQTWMLFMARPLRLEFAGALYHVTARGDRREPIYTDEQDRCLWLHVLDEVCQRFNWVIHAYCQMTNHYHFVVETPDANLSQGMRQLNGVYTQRFNRRHGLVGHLFQGRYKAILVQKESYLLEVSRYVVLNPVRAGMVGAPQDWPWSSFRVMLDGHEPELKSLDTEWSLSWFGLKHDDAVRAYAQFVISGIGKDSPLADVQHQLILGDDEFVRQHKGSHEELNVRNISKAQRRVLAKSLGEYRSEYPSRDEAMARAYYSGAYSMREIGDYFGVHAVTVARAVRRLESGGD